MLDNDIQTRNYNEMDRVTSLMTERSGGLGRFEHAVGAGSFHVSQFVQIVALLHLFGSVSLQSVLSRTSRTLRSII